MSISGLLNVTKQSLSAFQTAIDVTGSNVANVGTAGYSRQTATFQAVGSLSAKGATAQLSVDVATIQRAVDATMQMRVVDQNAIAGYADGKYEILQGVETLLDETSDNNLNDVLEKFWGSWDDLAANPSGIVERYALVSASQQLVAKFNDIGTRLEETQRNIDNNLASIVDTINEKTAQIAALNKAVFGVSRATGEANNLLDQRDQAIKELAELVSFDYIEDGNGSTNVYLNNGRPLVEGVTSRNMELVNNATTTHKDVVLDGFETETLNSVLTTRGEGKLGSYLYVRDTMITDYISEINTIAKAVMDEVNAAHTTGYDGDGEKGLEFFVVSTPGSTNYARDMMVNSAISADTDKIASSSTLAGNDGAVAQQIAALKDEEVIGTATIGTYYASFIGNVGGDVSLAKQEVTYQVGVLDQLVNQREAISGVSLDEEMMNLIRFQMGYNAAGRLAQVANELMEILINLGK